VGLTSHVHLQLVEGDLLLAVGTQRRGGGGGGAFGGRLGARHVVVADAKRLPRGERGFGGGLGGLGPVARFGAVGYLGGFVGGVGVVIGGWGGLVGVEVHGGGGWAGLGYGVGWGRGWWVHGVLLLLLLVLWLVVGLLGGVGVVVWVFVCGHGFFDAHVVRLQGHHGFLLERGGLQVVERGGAGEVGLVVGFGEEDGFDDDEIVPVDLRVFDCVFGEVSW